jgi:hypothetical protein
MRNVAASFSLRVQERAYDITFLGGCGEVPALCFALGANHAYILAKLYPVLLYHECKLLRASLEFNQALVNIDVMDVDVHSSQVAASGRCL